MTIRKLLVLGVTFIILVHVPHRATATTVVVQDALNTFMWGTLNACAWAFTKAHKNVGNTWQGDNTPSQATCTTNGVAIAQSNPLDAIATHAAPRDQVQASADARCNTPNCSTFTLHNPITVVSKPHSIAAGTYARVGTAAGNTITGGTLKGPTVSIVDRMNLSSGTDPYESVFALAITDQPLNKWNSGLARLLDITDQDTLPRKRCMDPPENHAKAIAFCGDTKNLLNIEWDSPLRTYYKLVVILHVDGHLEVQQTLGAGTTIDLPITEQDFEVKSKTCEGSASDQQTCFTAKLKNDLPRHLTLQLPEHQPMSQSSPPQFTVDTVYGIVDRPPSKQ